jgi:plastocyanin
MRVAGRRLGGAVSGLGRVSDQLCEGGSPAPTWTFTTPGRYLVICTFLPHFETGMYGWVTVRDR